ncbi:thioredoxin-disulfide reductase [Gemmatimonadota bacterium]
MSSNDIRNVIIIGSGPAGFTAALYNARANLAPLVLAGPEPGGQLMITTDIENFPGFPEGVQGPELMQRFEAQAERFGTEVRRETVESLDLSASPFSVTTAEGTYRGKTVIVSTGASARWLGLESETRFRGRGVSACATCDGFFFKDKVITVVGGGDTAVEEATYLTRFGSKVYMAHRRDELRASQIMQKRAFNNDKIEILWNSVVIEVLGEDLAGVTAVRLKDTQTGEEREHATDGLFLGIGHDPNTAIFKGILDMDEEGYLLTDGVKTNVDGVFACGDVTDHVYRQAITAAGMGCQAAIEAEHWLEARE